MIGETLGSYEIIEQIGVGGMGAVFLARHKLIDRKVAIKVLLAEYSNRDEAVKRFFNEAKATASLRHPSLVDVIDFGYAQDGSAYLVMEYLQGENLGARLRKVNRLPLPQALEFARQIAVGVGIAHAAGIVHRDLKPDNVFLVPSPVDPSLEIVKLLDFGIAKITGQMAGGIQKTQTGMMLGTPLYMAPEQCRGAGYVDARSDTYAFGCILFAMVAGRPPFIHEFPGELIAAHLHEQPPSLKTLRPEVPASLSDLTDKLLAKAPEARPENMAAVTKALGKIAHELGIAGTMMLPGAGYLVSSNRTGERTTTALPTSEDAVAAPAEQAERPAQSTRLLSSSSAAAAFGVSAPKAATSTTLSAGASELSAKAVATTQTAKHSQRPVLAIALAATVVLLGAGYFTVGKTGKQGINVRQAPSVQPVTQPAPRVQEQQKLPPPVVVATSKPVQTAEPAVPPAPAKVDTALPTAAPARDESSAVFIRVKNARQGLVVSLDGQRTSLPVKVPRDGKNHKLRFETSNFHPEDHGVKANRDRVITLANKPFLFLE